MHQFKIYITKFNEYLKERNIFFEGVVIGGVAMQLMEISDRVTKDCDILFPVITDEVRNAAVEFGKANQLAENWFNNGPANLIRDLPEGWERDLIELYSGSNIKLQDSSIVEATPNLVIKPNQERSQKRGRESHSLKGMKI